jgi:hypothetical protein
LRAIAAKTVPAQVRKSFAVIRSRNFFEVVAHIGRCNVLAVTLVINVLQKLLAGQLLTGPYDLGYSPVLHPKYFRFRFLAIRLPLDLSKNCANRLTVWRAGGCNFSRDNCLRFRRKGQTQHCALPHAQAAGSTEPD